MEYTYHRPSCYSGDFDRSSDCSLFLRKKGSEETGRTAPPRLMLQNKRFPC